MTQMEILTDVRENLALAVERAARQGADTPVLRVRVTAPQTNAFRWLAAQPKGTRALWSSRGTDRVVAMSGMADVYEAGDRPDFDRLSQYMTHHLDGAHPAVRYYGGIRFDGGRPMSQEWSSFGSLRMVLPRFELVVDGSTVELVCNLVPHHDRARLASILEQIRALAWPGKEAASPLPHAVDRQDLPTRSEWLARVAESLDVIEANEIQKVVLARRSTFVFDGSVSPIDLIARLYAEAPNRFHYLIETEEGSAFLGATPERLVRREDSYVFTEAVAGTRPAVDDETDDAELLAALMASDKEQREHLCVRWAIEEILRPFC
ncbi:MAG: menaquinone-specific isochorismate synthase, partial [Rhodothermales bacterium]